MRWAIRRQIKPLWFTMVMVVAMASTCLAQPATQPAASTRASNRTAANAELLRLGDWVVTGDGKAMATSGAGGAVQDGKLPLRLTNAKLEQGRHQVCVTLRLPANAEAGFSLGEGNASNTLRLSAAADGRSVRLGRNNLVFAEPNPQNVLATILLTSDELIVTVGSISESRDRVAGESGPLQITLTRGAGVESITEIALTQPLLLPLPGIESQANRELTFDSDHALPRGVATIAGLPFFLSRNSKNAVDVAASMSGLKDPTRNKNFNLSTSVTSNGRTVLSVPGDQYSQLHVLAFSLGRSEHVPRMTVRVGSYGNGGGNLVDVVAPVPELNSKSSDSPTPVTLVVEGQRRSGFLHHVRVPMAMTANVKEFERFDLEFTRDLNAHVTPPDPNEFGAIPIGPPSDVVILAATLERSPVTFNWAATELGNVFHDQQKAIFNATLTNRSQQQRKVRLFAKVSGPGTGTEVGIESRAWVVEQSVTLAPDQSQVVPLDVTPGKRGWYQLNLGVESEGIILQQRDTSFAVLAPDTRKAGDDSPFGTWVFWTAHNAVRADAKSFELAASLLNKAGFRWTYGGKIPDEALAQQLSERYRFKWTLLSLPESYQRNKGWFDAQEFESKVAPVIAKRKSYEEDQYKVLHESRSSNDLLRRFSDTMGGPSYDMPAEERAQVDTQAANVLKYCLAIKRVDPAAKIVLFNDYPGVVGQYFQRDFPKDAFDVIGLEGAMFLRQPERQPDWLSVLGNMQEIKRRKEKHNYSHPVWTTEALYHPTEKGALSLHEQAVIYVREAMMILHLGVERMAAAGCIQDSADDYRWSNWGSVGFCHRDPEVNPKPSYAMYAWMTQVLDQAKPDGQLATPNPALHAVKFKRVDGSIVCALWTADGTQQITLKTRGTTSVFDAYGNPISLSGNNNELSLLASPTPMYVCATAVESVANVTPIEVKTEQGELLCDFNNPAQFKFVREANNVLESNWAMPRIRGDFSTEFTTEDGASVLTISLKPDDDARKLFSRYTTLELDKPIELPSRPYEFAVRLKGNGAWGQVMFELVDAKGRVWNSGGNIYDGASNAADPRSLSYVRAAGWQTLRIPIVGMYPGKDQSIYWPTNYNWWPSNAPEVIDAANNEPQIQARYEQQLAAHVEAMKAHAVALAAYEKDIAAGKRATKPKAPTPPRKPNLKNMGLSPVDYPLKLTRIMVSMRPNILIYDREVQVEKPVIQIDRLGVIAPPGGI